MVSEGEALWQEAQALRELIELRRDPVYTTLGLPRGDGRLVMVIPGLFGNDLYLQPLRSWLGRLGYSPGGATLALNAGCPNRLRERVETALRRGLRWRPGPVVLVGHSRGGVLSWALASRLQEQASHVILLGSPAAAAVSMLRLPPEERTMRLPGASRTVADAGARATRFIDPDCTYPNCGCPYPEDLARPLSPNTRVLSVYSRDDPVVAPNLCHMPGAENIEVRGTHSGLVYNRTVYPEIAPFLASR